MSYCTWFVQGKILLVSLRGHVELYEIEALGRMAHEKRNSTQAHEPLYLLVDASQLLTLPRAVGALKKALNWLGEIGIERMIIHSSPSPTNCVLLRLAARAQGIPCIAVGTEADAYGQLTRLGVLTHDAYPASGGAS